MDAAVSPTEARHKVDESGCHMKPKVGSAGKWWFRVMLGRWWLEQGGAARQLPRVAELIGLTKGGSWVDVAEKLTDPKSFFQATYK